jgi:hypothetical protein
MPQGAPPSAVSPPIAVPGPGAAPTGYPPREIEPEVESFDELVYRCKPGDTMAAVSKAYYQSERYAQALLLFNRHHPQAADPIRHDPPQLQMGTLLFIPPLRILEKRHATAIAQLPPLAVPAPDRVAAAGGRAPGALTGAAGGGAAGYRLYRVRGRGGEMMREVARLALNNGERWMEVYRLNPQYRPEFPVPENAVLRLPPDARVDQAHLP